MIWHIYLKSINPIYFEEFFCDHILRKVMVGPEEYIQFPPAIKTFYRFLAEKQYLTNEESIIKIIDKIEPRFLKILKKRFSWKWPVGVFLCSWKETIMFQLKINFYGKYSKYYLDFKHKKELPCIYPETFNFIYDSRNLIEIVMKYND